MEPIQNFVVDLKENANSFWDFVYAPCIMLLSKYQNRFKYCHFDEDNFDELKSFVDFVYENGSKKIGLFGGWESLNIPKLIRHIKGKNMQILSQKDFVDFAPLEEITARGNLFCFSGSSNKKEYSFSDLYNLFS